MHRSGLDLTQLTNHISLVVVYESKMSNQKRNIWKYQKKGDKITKPVEAEKSGQLYFRMNRRTGRMETNLLEWERQWKSIKITEYPAEYAEALRTGVMDEFDRDASLAPFALESEMDTTMDTWLPTDAQWAEMEAIPGVLARARREKEMFAVWKQFRLDANADIRTANEIKKAERDLKIKEMDNRQSTILNIIGTVLGDMTKESRLRVEEYVRPLGNDEDEENHQTVNIEEARARLDWLFVFN